MVHSDDPVHYEHGLRLGATWNAVVAVNDAISREVKVVWTCRIGCTPFLMAFHFPHSANRRRGRPRSFPLLYARRSSRYQKRVLDLPCILKALAARGVAVELTVAGSGPDQREFLLYSAQSLVDGQMRLWGACPTSRCGR